MTTNNPDLEHVAEKLCSKNLIDTSQVVGCWLYLEGKDGKTAVEVFFLADTTIHVQFMKVSWNMGILSRAIVGHDNVKTFGKLEDVLTAYFMTAQSKRLISAK